MFKKTIAVLMIVAGMLVVEASAGQKKVSPEKFKECKEAAIQKLEEAGWHIKDFMYILHVVAREDAAEQMCAEAGYKISKLNAAPYKELIETDMAEQEEMSKSN